MSCRHVSLLVREIGWVLCWVVAPLVLAGSPKTDTAKASGAKTSAKAAVAAKTAETVKSKSAEATAEKTQFIRLTKDAKDRPVSLDIAITTYTGKNAAGEDVRVDLVGVVHIADKAYYERLNKEFEKYDAVLYELVAPKGARPARGTAGIYSPLASMLELADQIAVVDYTKKNFVHADMTGAEMLESMKKRDEHWLKIVGQAIGQAIAQSSDPEAGTSDGDLIVNLLTSRNPALALKRTMAPQFTDLEASTAWLDGPDGSTILTERNKVALKVLAEQLKAGKKRLAVFYGAAHLPDMERRLLSEFKLRRGDQAWLAAWSLSADPAGKSRPKKEKVAEKISKEKVSAPAKAREVSEKEFLEASRELLSDPTSQAAKDHAQTVIAFTVQTPKAIVVLGDEEAKWFGEDENRRMLLVAGYSAGNVQSQLHSGVARNDRYAGLVTLFKVYRGLQAKDSKFKIAAVEDLLALHRDDKLLRHVVELEEKDSTKLPRVKR